MARILSTEEQNTLHHRYRNSDLFRQWSPILCKLEWERNELDVISIWWETERCLQALRDEKDNRDEMIPFLLKQLLKDYRTFEEGDRVTQRTALQAELTAVTVMCVLLFRLLNTVEKGHEEEAFDNRAICVAITNLIRNHPYFKELSDNFFKRDKDNNGKKVVITANDPMLVATPMEDMDEKAREEIEQTKQKILELTAGLKACLMDQWDNWARLVDMVCLDVQLLNLMKDVKPNNNDWQMNQRLVCNLIGMFKQKKNIVASVRSINETLSKKQLSSYIRNHADYEGNDSSLSKELHLKVEGMIDRLPE